MFLPLSGAADAIWGHIKNPYVGMNALELLSQVGLARKDDLKLVFGVNHGTVVSEDCGIIVAVSGMKRNNKPPTKVGVNLGCGTAPCNARANREILFLCGEWLRIGRDEGSVQRGASNRNAEGRTAMSFGIHRCADTFGEQWRRGAWQCGVVRLRGAKRYGGAAARR